MCLRFSRLRAAPKMPLLSRYKANPGGSSSSSPSMPTTGRHGQSSNQQAQVCQSPLFGSRRQLNSASSNQQAASGTSRSMSPTLSGSNQQRQELPQQISQQQIHYTFALMDTNGDGMIDLHDLTKMLANLGVSIDESILSYIITTVSRRGEFLLLTGTYNSFK